MNRPILHFTPPDGWMNDPNGLIWHKGEWHLFYQHTPPEQKGGLRFWGHAVSRNLVDWKHLPIALSPDALGDIWSGSITTDASSGQMIAAFTHHLPMPAGSSLPPTSAGIQRQSLATSHDRGRTWEKYANNPVLEDAAAPNFRDPKIWRDLQDDCWRMAIAGGDGVWFYASPDLLQWELTSRFTSPDIPSHWVWECPDLFAVPLEGGNGEKHWVLNISLLDSINFRGGFGMCAMRYFVGRFEGGAFIADSGPQATSHGLDDYAAVTWADAPDNRAVFLGWMSHWAYAGRVPTTGIKGCMTLPRELTLRTGAGAPQLLQRPVPELMARRAGLLRDLKNITVAPGQNPLAGLHGDSLEFEITVIAPPSGTWGLQLLGAEVGVSANGTLYLDRRRCGETSFHPSFAVCHSCDWHEAAQPGGLLRLHVFLDRWCIDVFAGSGERYLPALIFPDADATEAAFFVNGDSPVTVETLRVYDHSPNCERNHTNADWRIVETNEKANTL